MLRHDHVVIYELFLSDGSNMIDGPLIEIVICVRRICTTEATWSVPPLGIGGSLRLLDLMTNAVFSKMRVHLNQDL